MELGPSEITIPSEIVDKWQRIVDLLANIVHVPSAVVCKLEPPHYTHYNVFSSSNSDGNPFPADAIFSMDIGTFCETVIKERRSLLVVNALEEEQWKHAPELKLGMVSYLGFPIVWPGGRMFGTICVLDNKANRYSDHYQELLLHCRDVLEADLQALVRQGDELKDQKAYLEELFARVPEAVVMVDREARITRVNPEFTKIFGYTEDQAIGHGIRELVAPDELQEETEGFLNRMFGTDEVFSVETVRRRKDGTRVPVSLICVPVPTHDGDRVGYIIYRDMTDSKRLEEEQRRHHKIQLELAHANRVATLGQLSAAIAHELNQPLAAITLNCGTCLRMLKSDTPDLVGAREAVQRTMRDSERASQVIARLHALFSNKETAFEVVDLNEAVGEVITLLRGEFQMNSVLLRTELAANLPCVSADRVQLQQVVLNLLQNAVDAMKTVDDRPRDLLIRTEGDEDNFVRFSIKDTGVGFSPHAVNKLFDAFYSTKDAGMGVGLSISHFIISNHRGRLWAALNEDSGATFSFSVPSIPISSLSSMSKTVLSV